MKNEFNERIIIKFIFNLLIKEKEEISYENIENKFYANKNKGINKNVNDEYIKFIDVLTHINNFEICYETVRYLFENITNKIKINSSHIQYFIEKLENIKNDYSIEKLEELFIDIIKHDLFFEATFKMAAIIINFILYKKIGSIIIFPYDIDIYHLIKSNKIIMKNRIIDYLIRNTEKYNIKRSISSSDNIKKEIEKVIKKKSIKGIKDIYLYGSYAKNTNNEFSDVDILIMNDKNFNISFCEIMEHEFYVKTNIPIDITISSDISDSFRNKIMKYAIKL